MMRTQNQNTLKLSSRLFKVVEAYDVYMFVRVGSTSNANLFAIVKEGEVLHMGKWKHILYTWNTRYNQNSKFFKVSSRLPETKVFGDFRPQGDRVNWHFPFREF